MKIRSAENKHTSPRKRLANHARFFQLASQRQGWYFSRALAISRFYDSSQPTARLFYILGFIKTENAASDLRPFPRSLNKVSRDLNLSNRVSEIYHNVLLSFWEAGPPILCSVGLKRKKRQDRESEISREVHTQSGQEAVCFDSLSLQVEDTRNQEGSSANVKTVPRPIYSAGIC